MFTYRYICIFFYSSANRLPIPSYSPQLLAIVSSPFKVKHLYMYIYIYVYIYLFIYIYMSVYFHHSCSQLSPHPSR